MSPVERAVAVYDAEACARTFREDLEAHLLHGYVFSTPQMFIMGRAVDSGAPYELVTDPWHVFAPEACDAWLCYLAAGDIRAMPAVLPYALRRIGFERKNVLRFYEWEKVRGRVLDC